jgi:hypothetical protein
MKDSLIHIIKNKGYCKGLKCYKCFFNFYRFNCHNLTVSNNELWRLNEAKKIYIEQWGYTELVEKLL